LGNDFLTLSFTTLVFSNIITYTRFPITIDANGLSMFASSHFVRAVQQRAKYNLSYNHHIHHTDQNRSTTIQPFSHTILTPNLNELDRLYQTLCKNAHQSTDDPLNFHLFHQNYPYSSQSPSHDRPFTDSLWLSPDKSVQTLLLPQPPHHPDPSSSKESQTSPIPPKITTNDTANKSIAVARYLNGATVLAKGETECITNGSIVSFVALSQASPRRCGGQGDITTGLNGALSVHILRSFREQTLNAKSHHIAPLSSSLAHNHFTTIEDAEKAQLDKTIAHYFTPPMLTAILSSWLLKYTAKRTFSSEYLTMHATSMIKMFPVVFKELRLQELNLEDDDGPSLK
jgi:NAD(P)H-hydrate repair Nnr-like enzyme with NAD(P)H-hydrate dehydratase domain